MRRAFLISRIAMPIRLAVFEKNWMLCCKEPHVHLQSQEERDMNARKQLPSGPRGEKPDRPAKLNIVRNYPVLEDRCQEEVGYGFASFRSRLAILTFSTYV